MEPVSVGVETVLYMFVIDFYVVNPCKFLRFRPGTDFLAEQVNIFDVFCMTELGMGQLMQKPGFAVGMACRIDYFFRARRPAMSITDRKRVLWEIFL